MNELNIVLNKLEREEKTWNSTKKILNKNNNLLKIIGNSISLSGKAESIIKHSIKNSVTSLDSLIKNISAMEIIIPQIVNEYKQTETNICTQNLFVEDPAFDGEGTYGGNQSNPVNKYKDGSPDLEDIVRKYYPDFSDEDIEKYLKKLENEGCGYVALSNTLFKQYIGKEYEFEKTFGFPMYDKNGDLNYDALVTDFYSCTDNHNERIFLWWKWDELNGTEDKSDVEGVGTTREKREYRWEKYLSEHNINVNVKNVDVTPENYNKISSKGDIIVGVSPVILYNEDGKEIYNGNGGHAMTVTGITADGMYKVSSWGREYYINSNNSAYDRIQFQQIKY